MKKIQKILSEQEKDNYKNAICQPLFKIKKIVKPLAQLLFKDINKLLLEMFITV